MRIISGKLKGRKFKVPSNFPVRPTTDFAREGLFNTLQNRIDLQETRLLDLYTGTGSISLEAWSRFCTSIVAVDEHHGCIRFLQKLCEELGIQEIKAKRADAEEFLKRSDDEFDLIFADPPYAFGRYYELLTLIQKKDILAPHGLLILEHDKQTSLSDQSGFVEEKKYGNVRFSFFERTS